ncbi:MAG: DUF1080 domain-containing protein [Candidatus Solibacter sp.]
MKLRIPLSIALGITAGAFLLWTAAAQQKPANADLGFTDTPILPGLPWHVHDPDRPHPPVVTPGDAPGAPPSDAVVLFDGKDLSKWGHNGRGENAGKVTPANWPVKDGYFECGRGDLVTKDKFGDVQLHVEWNEPPSISGTSQARGNSGILLMSRYELQVLDAFKNPTYADGQAGAIYGQWPPLANPSRPQGQWQVYDIVFEAPRFAGEKLVKPAYQTLFMNNVLMHNRKEVMGAMVYRKVATYSAHGAEEPIMIQDHNNPVRFRNIWVRRLRHYDEAEKP